MGLLGSMMLRSRKSLDQTQATSNARQIGMVLFDFESEYGRFPDASTIAEVKKKTSTDWPLADATSNDLLKQLIVTGLVSSEGIFFAKGSGIHRSDERFRNEGEALAPGECGFAYLPGQLSVGNPSRPLLVAPLIPGTRRFDPKPFDGKAIVLRMDNSVSSVPITRDGRVLDGRGVDLLDPTNTVWVGNPPVIKWQAIRTAR